MLNMFLDVQKQMQQEYFNAWGRMINVPTIPNVYRDLDATAAPHDVVYEEDSLKLLHYRNEHGVDFAEPLLVCFALVNRPYILDLQTDRSVVRQYLKRGFDVYLIDWGIPTAADRTMRIKDYVCGLMKNVADFVCDETQSDQLNLLGYCMGGTFSTMFNARYPELIRNLILMAAPIDFSDRKSLLNVWTEEANFDVDTLIDTYGNCPGSFLQTTFQMMKPVNNYLQKYSTFYDRLHDERFIENFLAMERWGNDNIPVAGETFREFVKCLYQKNQLVKGEFRLAGENVDLGQITNPVLALTADSDHLVSPEATLALRDHIGTQHWREMSINAGHIGLAVSRKAHHRLWPDAAMWLADGSTAI